MEIISHSNEETSKVAADILALLKKKSTDVTGMTKEISAINGVDVDGVDKSVVVGLVGDLGSGKTTFSQYIAKLLGVTNIVTSPTFIIEKIYTGTDTVFPQLIHIDAYRLENGRDLSILGFEDILKKKGTLVLVEWPERVRDILPADTLTVNFKFIDENTRSISYDF